MEIYSPFYWNNVHEKNMKYKNQNKTSENYIM